MNENGCKGTSTPVKIYGIGYWYK